MNKLVSKTIVIIPAYCEFDNLKILIPQIYKYYPEINVSIIDDSPKNEFLKTKKYLVPKYKNLSIFSRGKKEGRGSAVLYGFSKFVNSEKISVFIEMDADLAHDPKEIGRLLSKIGNYDVVIGSRYIDKSRIINWPFRRLFQSRIINFFINYWLGLNVSDYTNGFRAYKKSCIKYLLKNRIYEKGFIVLSEIIYILKKANFNITEVPITFKDRTMGKSNANLKELLISLLGVIKIKFHHV